MARRLSIYGGVLEGLERGVGLERLAKRRRTRITDVVAVETAQMIKPGMSEVSAGADAGLDA